MVARVMFVDVAQPRWLYSVAAGAILFLAIGLTVGIFGPATYEDDSISAYDCVGSHNSHKHIWNNNNCSGIQLGQPSAIWTHTIRDLDPLNGFWSLLVVPYTVDDSKTIQEKLQIEISIWGANGDGPFFPIKEAQKRDELLLCNKGNPKCWTFALVYEDNLKYEHYKVAISLPDENNEAKKYIGDMEFNFIWYNVDFVEEQLTMRVTFLVIATALILWFWWNMRAIEITAWTLEQKCLAVLLLSLVALNNPFYPLEYLVSGWFFPSVDAALQVIHAAINMCFWLAMFDHYRRGNASFTVDKWDSLKPLVVSIYAILTLTFFVWFRVQHQVDPIFGDTEHVSGLVVLFFICSLCFGSIMVWILVLMMLAVPAVWGQQSRGHTAGRFLYLAAPTMVCLFSIIGGLFFGSFGPVRRTALSFCYFYTLFNVFVWVMFIGYYPIENKFGAKETASESSSIFERANANISTQQTVDATENISDNVYGGDDAL